MLLQKLPDTHDQYSTDQPEQADSDAWNRAVIIADTLKPEELSLPARTLLQRLYSEDDIRLFDAQKVTFHCSCSRENVILMLKMLGRGEVDSILTEREKIEVHCEFCNQLYEFDKVDAEVMFIETIVLPPSEAKH
jgi:molecular chaperone Hsp33